MIFSRLSGDMEPGERLHIVREMERSVKVEFDQNIFYCQVFVLSFQGYRSLHRELSQARTDLEHQRANR